VLFDRPETDLPRVWPGDDYWTFLAGMYADYITAIQLSSSESPVAKRLVPQLNKVSNLIDRIQKGVLEYLRGHPADSYVEIVRGINEVLPELQKLLTIPTVGKHLSGLPVYRVRKLMPDGEIARFSYSSWSSTSVLFGSLISILSLGALIFSSKRKVASVLYKSSRP